MAKKPKTDDLTGVTHLGNSEIGQLRAFIERIEVLNEEKSALTEDIKEVFAEAKGTGFDTKIVRKVIAVRKMDRDKRAEEEALLDLYLSALGVA